MRVPDQYLKCVGFIGEATSEDPEHIQGDLLATGFFVAVPCESVQLSGYSTLYFVTAKHVAASLQNKGVYIVANKRGGGITDKFTSPDDAWWLHPTDATADVALIHVAANPEADTIAVALEYFGLPQRLRDHHIGVGDEVFAVGLFTEVPAITQSTPIVRHGNIAMMPTDQIQTELEYADVYLVEARSLGGVSGSPVFAHNTLIQKVALQNGTESVLMANGPGMTLLGLIHGHWDVRESEINEPSITHDRKRGVNYGMAIVVPAIKIYETLFRAELVEMRRKQEEALLRRGVPGTDLTKSDNAANTFTK